ncbi:hypothetical protein Pth03_37770 [Planotetraspora thailandica]|uniref:Uncharacterized protein n=1 Tax=Planotetraspora thailandica TaxID=487172 RepID=A0A8J3V248_9ACTN|nr:hypothetical protein [Planotetraspora thailandica]GII55388.1 hypothetical protein Pth03_37770 [Planotetraspora thailandica]
MYDDLIRDWKDPESRAVSGGAGHPAGAIELGGGAFTDAIAASTEKALSLGCCNGLTDKVACHPVFSAITIC